MRVFFAVVAFTLAAVRFTLADAVSMTNAAGTRSGTYSQTFNALASSGSAPWESGITLVGWQAQATKITLTNYAASVGATATGGLYSFGSAASSDRALGSLGSGTPGDFLWGLTLRNDTGLTLTNVTLAFRGEQWRVANEPAQTLTCSYRVADAEPETLVGVGYTALAPLDFASPVTSQTGQATDGNDPACSYTLTHSWSVSIPSDAYLVLRWSDPDHAGTDHGLAIDDVSLTWTASAGEVPPETAPAMAVGARGAGQNLNGGGANDLPEGLRVAAYATVRTNGSFATAGTVTTRSAVATRPINAGSYTFCSSADTADRAIGGLSSDSNAKTVTLFARCRNATPSAVRAWQVAYAVEKYRTGTRAYEILLLHSSDGENWSAVPDGSTLFAADSDTEGYAPAPVATVPCALTVTTAPVPPNGVFYLAWRYSVATGATTSNAQALGIDDIFIKPVFPVGTVLMLR